jgi:hypothetical protein
MSNEKTVGDVGLTDTRIEEIWERIAAGTTLSGTRAAFARAIEREVAAQMVPVIDKLIEHDRATRAPADLSGLTAKLREALTWALAWIDAVPSDTALPTMPGFDRDYVNGLLDESKSLATRAPADLSGLTEKQIAAAARTLADFNADSCGVNRDDNWKLYGDEFIVEAKLMLAAATKAAQPAAGLVPEGYVLMPKALTDANGAKSHFMGEFKETLRLGCPDCDPDGESCDTCGDSGEVAHEVIVCWDTIKRIYALAVDRLAAPVPPVPAAEQPDVIDWRSYALHLRDLLKPFGLGIGGHGELRDAMAKCLREHEREGWFKAISEARAAVEALSGDAIAAHLARQAQAKALDRYMEASIALDAATDNFYGQAQGGAVAESEQDKAVAVIDGVSVDDGNVDFDLKWLRPGACDIGTRLYASAAATRATGQPPIGRLLDEFSALPVLWGLNEPGALMRHSDVFKMLVNAGKTYLAAPSLGSAPQATPVAQEGEQSAPSKFGSPELQARILAHASAQAAQADVRDAALEEAARLTVSMTIHPDRNPDFVDGVNFGITAYRQSIRALKRTPADDSQPAVGGAA